jgi:hypothetical protein
MSDTSAPNSPGSAHMAITMTASPTLRPIGISIPADAIPNLIPLPGRRPNPLIVDGRIDLHALAASCLSPDSAFNVLRDREWTAEGTLAIVKGIINAIHTCQTEHDRKVGELEDNIQQLRNTLAGYKETFDMAPEGFKLATNTVAQIEIPVGNRFHRLAKWVKRLNDGCVACYHKGQGPKDTPYIAELYAPPDYDDEHPMEPLEPWFRRIMSGSAAHYSILLKEVNDIWEWGMRAEVERYQRLDGQIRYTNNQIDIMRSELEALQTQRLLCENRLIASRIQDKVGHLASHFSWMPGAGRPPAIGRSGWKPRDKKGKGRACTEEPRNE